MGMWKWADNRWIKGSVLAEGLGSFVGQVVALIMWAGGMIGAVLSWLDGRSYLEMGAAFLGFSFMAAIILLLTALAALAAQKWQQGNPLSTADDSAGRTSDTKAPAPPGSLTVSVRYPLKPEDLFVTSMSFDERSSPGHQIRIFVEGFSACRSTIAPRKIDGSAIWEGQILGNVLLTPSPLEITGRSPFLLSLIIETVPQAMADALSAIEAPVRLDFTQLKIAFVSHEDLSAAVYLPIWQGIVISPNRNRTQTGKAAQGSGSAMARAG